MLQPIFSSKFRSAFSNFFIFYFSIYLLNLHFVSKNKNFYFENCDLTSGACLGGGEGATSPGSTPSWATYRGGRPFFTMRHSKLNMINEKRDCNLARSVFREGDSAF